MAKKKQIALNNELAEKYQISGSPISGKFSHPKYGLVDFYKMTVAQADRLVKAGFPYLKQKKTSS